MSVEQELRRELSSRAGSFTPPADLLAGVRRRRARVVRRRRIQAVSVSVVLVLLVLAPTLLLSARDAPAGPAVALVAPPAAPTFPLTPAWEPEWAGLRSFEYRAGESTTMRYDATFPRDAALEVVVGTADPGLRGESVIVGTHAATLEGDRLAWRLAGEWVLVAGTGRVTQEDLLHFASSLRDAPLRMDLPFELAVVPADGVLVAFDRSSMRLRRMGSDAWLEVVLVAAADADHIVDEFRGVRVEADPAWGLTAPQLETIARGAVVTNVAVTRGA
jgi:hypothetical protein